MHFNDTCMGIEVSVPVYFRNWNNDQNLFDEITFCISADYP